VFEAFFWIPVTNSWVFRTEFEKIVDGLSDALDFAKTIGVESNIAYEQGGGRGTMGEVDFYTRCVTFSIDYSFGGFGRKAGLR
jgi:hypothetical protein